MRILRKSRSGEPQPANRVPGSPTKGTRGIRRMIKVDPSKGITQPEFDGLYQVGAQASLTTACAGADNDLVYTADLPGTAGNSIRVRYVVAGASTPLTIAVAGNDITVNVATNGGSAATSTAAQVKAAIDGSAPASALVSCALAPGNSGTGVVAAFAYTNLTGGVDRTDVAGSMGDGRQGATTLVKGATPAPNAGVRTVTPANTSRGLRRR